MPKGKTNLPKIDTQNDDYRGMMGDHTPKDSIFKIPPFISARTRSASLSQYSEEQYELPKRKFITGSQDSYLDSFLKEKDTTSSRRSSKLERKKRRTDSEIESLAQKIRESANQEKMVIIDCLYIRSHVEEWWSNLSENNKNKFLELEIPKNPVLPKWDHRLSVAQNEENSRTHRINKRYYNLKKDEYESSKYDLQILKSELKEIFENNLTPEDKDLFSKITKPEEHVSAICMTDTFKTQDARLGYAVHESLSDLFGINDIKYPHEEHKKLYVKQEGLNARGWGNGRGDINPHNDDNYEEGDIKFLSLTVVKDDTNEGAGTKTIFYQAKNILALLTDVEIERLTEMEADFFSGRNVSGLQLRNTKRPLNYDEKTGEVTMFLDFREDTTDHWRESARMTTKQRSDTELLKKIKGFFENYDRYFSSETRVEDMPGKEIPGNEPLYTIPKTGTFALASNKQVLHGRGILTLDHLQRTNIEEGLNDPSKEIDLETTPRFMYRSKGTEIEKPNPTITNPLASVVSESKIHAPFPSSKDDMEVVEEDLYIPEYQNKSHLSKALNASSSNPSSKDDAIRNTSQISSSNNRNSLHKITHTALPGSSSNKEKTWMSRAKDPKSSQTPSGRS